MEKRNTIQKTLVLNAVNHLACHPTADDVYVLVAGEHPTISRATVYRNLSSLCNDGEIRHVEMPNAADRYDHNTYQHYHIECVKCGAFSDAPCEYNLQLDKAIEKQTGYTQIKHNLFVTGICSKCLQK